MAEKARLGGSGVRTDQSCSLTTPHFCESPARVDRLAWPAEARQYTCRNCRNSAAVLVTFQARLGWSYARGIRLLQPAEEAPFGRSGPHGSGIVRTSIARSLKRKLPGNAKENPDYISVRRAVILAITIWKQRVKRGF
ncbi:hypothetical protein Bbelb_012860 [Branchiostoma belcheri]|nr:hypothetical protein Bbelb_012860 [Branchiostoma belcheri]